MEVWLGECWGFGKFNSPGLKDAGNGVAMAAGTVRRVGSGVAVGATRNMPSGVGGGDWVAEGVSSVGIDGIGVAATVGDASGAVTVASSSVPQAT